MTFVEYVTPKANPVYARYTFYNKVQGQHEPIEQFVTELKLLVKDCSFKDPKEMIRDRIVFGTNLSKMTEKLISVGADLSLSCSRKYPHTPMDDIGNSVRNAR